MRNKNLCKHRQVDVAGEVRVTGDHEGKLGPHEEKHEGCDVAKNFAIDPTPEKSSLRARQNCNLHIRKKEHGQYEQKHDQVQHVLLALEVGKPKGDQLDHLLPQHPD